MSERQILITFDEEELMWDDSDQEWLMERLNATIRQVISKHDYTIQEFTK